MFYDFIDWIAIAMTYISPLTSVHNGRVSRVSLFLFQIYPNGAVGIVR